MPVSLATASITTQNTGTAGCKMQRGLYTISLSGTFSGTVHLQRAFEEGPGTADWFDIKSYAAATEENGEAAEQQQVRLFCKTGNYSSGTAEARVSQ